MGGIGVAVGSLVARQELHERLGGRLFHSIAPSSRANLIMLFTSASDGPSIMAGWGQDGLFYFMGEGLSGPQTMTQGNRSLLRHREDGRELHLFTATDSGGQYRYLGQFTLDASRPYAVAEAPDASGQPRSVFLFRLRPVGQTSTEGPVLEDVPTEPVEVRTTWESHPVPRLQRQVASVQRTEAEVRHAYSEFLLGKGHELRGAQIRVPGEAGALRVDLVDATDNRLIEVVRDPTRSAIRLAIGRLLDYRRFFSPTPQLAILTTGEPREDLLDLCGSLLIEVIWPSEGTFTSTFD